MWACDGMATRPGCSTICPLSTPWDRLCVGQEVHLDGWILEWTLFWFSFFRILHRINLAIKYKCCVRNETFLVKKKKMLHNLKTIVFFTSYTASFCVAPVKPSCSVCRFIFSSSHDEMPPTTQNTQHVYYMLFPAVGLNQGWIVFSLQSDCTWVLLNTDWETALAWLLLSILVKLLCQHLCMSEWNFTWE